MGNMAIAFLDFKVTKQRVIGVIDVEHCGVKASHNAAG